MNLINQFGRMVSSESLKDPEKARRLLLMGYRLQEKRLKFFPDKNLPDSAHYVARIVMKNIILIHAERRIKIQIFHCLAPIVLPELYIIGLDWNLNPLQ